MPRIPKIEQHKDYEKFKRQLLDQNSPPGTQRDIARKVGVTEQAISQYKAGLLKKVKEKVQILIAEKKHEGIISEFATIEIDEIERLATNIARIEEIVGPLHSLVAEMVKNLTAKNYYQLDVGMVHLIRGLLVDSTKMLEVSKKVKGELQPEIQINLQFNEIKTQENLINEFIIQLLKEKPELLDQYEAYVVERKNE